MKDVDEALPKGLEVTCCSQPMREMGLWPIGDIKTLFSRLHCEKCNSYIAVLDAKARKVEWAESA